MALQLREKRTSDRVRNHDDRWLHGSLVSLRHVGRVDESKKIDNESSSIPYYQVDDQGTDQTCVRREMAWYDIIRLLWTHPKYNYRVL